MTHHTHAATMVKFSPGTHVSHAARQLVDAAKVHGEVTGTFNEITLRATPDTTPEQVVAAWEAESEARAKAYRESPQGIEDARRNTEEIDRAQQKYDALVSALDRLDFSNHRAVIDWVVAMQAPSDRVGVTKQSAHIIRQFEAHGWMGGANCGADYDGENCDNSARYIVGQALSCIEKMGAIHGIIHKFAGEWKAKFWGERQ